MYHYFNIAELSLRRKYFCSKGQAHEIFDPRFHDSNHQGPLSIAEVLLHMVWICGDILICKKNSAMQLTP